MYSTGNYSQYLVQPLQKKSLKKSIYIKLNHFIHLRLMALQINYINFKNKEDACRIKAGEVKSSFKYIVCGRLMKRGFGGGNLKCEPDNFKKRTP